MIVRMAEAAGRRRRHEWVMLAQVVAAGVNAGFSGDWKAIQALARALDVELPGPAATRAQGGQMRDLVSRLYARLGVRYAGPDGR